MPRTKTFITGLVLLFSVCSLLPAGEIPMPIFYAPFDSNTKAAIASGKAEAEGGGAEIVREGKFAGAARFRATTGIPYRTQGNLRADRGTIAFWVKPVDWSRGNAGRTFINAGTGAPYYTWGEKIMIQKAGLNGEVKAITGPSASTAKVSWRNGTWHHIAVTYYKGTGKIYLDGQEAAAMPHQRALSDIGERFWVGTTPFIGPWAKEGSTLIDDLRIYDRPLDAGEISAIMHGYRAELRRGPNFEWEVRVELDPAISVSEDGRVKVAVFRAEDGKAPLATRVVPLKERKAVIPIRAGALPTGPLTLQIQVIDAKAKFDPILISTRKTEEPLVRLKNGIMEIGFDPLDGSVLTMRDLKRGVNYRKALPGSPILSLVTTPWASTSATYQGEDVTILEASEKTCKKVELKKERGRQMVEMLYEFPPYLKVTCTVSLADESPLSEWRIKVENVRPERPSRASIVQRVNFPLFTGLVIGKDETKNFLALPRFQGQLIPNPASGGGYMFADEPEKIYPGNASMSWMDLYGEGCGLYIGSHDPALPATALISKGVPSTKSVTMGIGKWAVLWPDETFEPGPVVVGIHEGDWHWGADRYREYWRANFAGRRRTPKWLEEADGWTGWGFSNYTFLRPEGNKRSLPQLIKGAKELGLNYLQLWSEMTIGDEAYHMVYYPDPYKGTPEDLKKAIEEVHKKGGHIGFYLFFFGLDPAVLFQLEREKYRTKIPGDLLETFTWSRGWPDVAVMGPEGSFRHGAPLKDWADGYWTPCPSAKKYQDYLISWCKRWSKEWGADAWYFDTLPLPLAHTPICYNTRHGHSRPKSLVQGVLEIYRRVQEECDRGEGFAISNEGVSDICAIYGTHALGTEMAAWGQPPKPEIFTYTFPDFPIFSGTCNGIHLGIFPGYENLDPNMYAPSNMVQSQNRVFLMGYRFDMINTFAWRKDELGEYVKHCKQILALRRKTKEHQYQSDFKDDVGLSIEPQDIKVEAKIFRHRRNKSFTITLLDRRREKSAITLTIDLGLYGEPRIGKVTLFTLDGGETPVEPKVSAGKLTLVVPPRSGDVASLLILTP